MHWASSSTRYRDSIPSHVGAGIHDGLPKYVRWYRTLTTSAAIQTLRVEKGLALTDLLTGMHALVLSLELPPPARVFLLDHMAQIEYRLSTNASERVQLSALLASVKAAVELAHTPPTSSS